MAQAESLFETYLAARLLRARRTLKRARAALLREPRDRTNLDRARHAKIETERLQAQLAGQAQRRAQARAGAAADGTPITPGDEPRAVASTQATAGFRAAQAARAEEYHAGAARGRRSLPEERRCPQCGNPVLGEASGCDCGYRFGRWRPQTAAEPFLSSEELAALRQNVKTPKRAE